MIRIACINQDRGISPSRSKGAAVHLAAMRRAFAQQDCEVIALDNPDSEALESAMEQAFSGGIDLIYERYALGQDTAARFARRHKIPFVLEVNSPLREEAFKYRGVEATAEDIERDAFLFAHAKYIVAVSSAVADYARASGARADRIGVHPNGVDLEQFNASVDGSRVRSRLGIQDKFVIGFHGRERPWHGFEALVEVVERLLSQSLAVHLLVVGQGDFEALSSIPQSAWSRVGWQPHEKVPQFVSAFDALPLTYQPDTPSYFSPLKLMEAMACGVVPVVPDYGDLTHIVTHGSSGRVYPAGNLERLCAELEDLTLHRDVASELGNNAAEVARAHSWAGIAQTVLGQVRGFDDGAVIAKSGAAS